MGEYQIIAMAAGMFFEFGIKDFIDILLEIGRASCRERV